MKFDSLKVAQKETPLNLLCVLIISRLTTQRLCDFHHDNKTILQKTIISFSDLDLQDFKNELTSFDNNSTKPLKKQKQALKVLVSVVSRVCKKNLVSTDSRNVFAATDWQVIMGWRARKTMLLKVAFHRQVVVCLSTAFGHSRFYCDLTWR